MGNQNLTTGDKIMKYNFQTYDESEAGMNQPKFLIQHGRPSAGYESITIRPVWVRNEKIRFYQHSSEAIFENFQITCQWNTYAQTDSSLNKPYGFHVEYSSGFNMDEIESIGEKTAFLKKINKELGKMQEKFGVSDTFEDYIMRISAILSIEKFVLYQDDRSWTDEIKQEFCAQDAKRYIRGLYTK